ncbi:MAG: GNAT family N-acetyltransferase [Micavibrio aeruginosavorus]|uniref:GNAT family N-acetyltransferase n=1 Tax=Micavibrio aeruginosavorus TaxID=349221 RepID=A0A7T5UGK4_9BACT|nr:MAG: GNAT family N-acetyltransferase [Micavibrio aeruginosavorus]
MSDSRLKPLKPAATVELASSLSPGEMQDLCDATDAAIENGGGFGWVRLPARDILERYWQGVMTMPQRRLFLARLDGVICGTCQLMLPNRNNEAQSFAVHLTANFVAPWARGHGLARLLLETAEKQALSEGFAVINLDVRETQEAAIQLFESMGYELFGKHPYYARVGDEIIRGRYYTKVIDPDLMQKLHS